jgi:hypothetical protein
MFEIFIRLDIANAAFSGEIGFGISADGDVTDVCAGNATDLEALGNGFGGKSAQCLMRLNLSSSTATTNSPSFRSTADPSAW